jgi:hypothetical protein
MFTKLRTGSWLPSSCGVIAVEMLCLLVTHDVINVKNDHMTHVTVLLTRDEYLLNQEKEAGCRATECLTDIQENTERFEHELSS